MGLQMKKKISNMLMSTDHNEEEECPQASLNEESFGTPLLTISHMYREWVSKCVLKSLSHISYLFNELIVHVTTI